LRQFIDTNQDLASALVLEFPQSAWRAMGEIEQACILALRALGVRFSMDHVQDLQLEPRDLADRGIGPSRCRPNCCLNLPIRAPSIFIPRTSQICLRGSASA
jgi:hypothetical protein